MTTNRKIEFSWAEVEHRAFHLAGRIGSYKDNNLPIAVYPVPRGGIFAALLVSRQLPRVMLVENLELADIIIDDIIDSGTTSKRYAELRQPFFALVNKIFEGLQGSWVSFPWERMGSDDGPQDNIRRILQFIGDDPNRDGLRETPDRVVRSYNELFAGYKVDPAKLIKAFENDGKYDEMIIAKNIEFSSICEHHMLPFVGHAHIGYVPGKDGGKVIGVSKLARILNVYAKRLQIQERLTSQITSLLDAELGTLGSACIIEATHLCMSCRGVNKQHSSMVTSSLTGCFRQPEVRAEFISLIKE